MQRFWQQVAPQSRDLPRKPPFFYLLPGVGFGVEHDGKRHAVPVPSPVADLKRIAAAASQHISGADRYTTTTSDYPLARELYGLWLDLGEINAPFFPKKTPHVTPLSLRFEALKESLYGPRDSEPRPEINHLRAILRDHGCLVKTSSALTLPPHIFRLGLLDIPFVSSEEQGIVGEGKGFDSAQSE